ncbi:hypothetical protein [Acinetobacter faecalis]|uniref:Replication protein n=1 Tax=Acinetobacter faecalis TaxID=2665161 RepID=A0ABU5GLF7_9GAMM|nr:hypothetical protein [Acinetobacter faecalis]MDY6511476.1 hypothetical protein [Acinetobacter faecalis]MDY6551125.1 hypothetical protein [Acinetobacter faecalis]
MTNKTKMLVQGDYPLIASPTLAQAYGVASAIFLQKLHYCLQSDNAQLFQQQKFFYHSYEQWVETLGTYSESTIKRIVSKLKKVGILVVKKLSQNKWIQTNFYSINYRKLSSLLKNSIQSFEPETVTQENIQAISAQPSHNVVKQTSTVKVTSGISSKRPAQSNNTQGLPSPLAPMASPATLEAMSSEKRSLYYQLLQLKVDIHYDDACLDEWLKNKKFIVHKAAYLKDQLGHLKMRWFTPEQIGLNVS